MEESREHYNLNILWNIYSDQTFSKEILYEEYKDFLENLVEINNPDFIALLNLKGTDKVLFSKNYNLTFAKNKKPSFNEIINAIDHEQLDKIDKVDLKYMKFVEENEIALQHTTFKLCFTASLIENVPRTYIRSILLIPRKYLAPHRDHAILIVAITDVTSLTGVHKRLGVDISYSYENGSEQRERLEELRKELHDALTPTIKLTAREREVLSLIAEGFTSEEIANKLFISITTVQTHRQNLIKKYKVKNTTALVNLI